MEISVASHKGSYSMGTSKENLSVTRLIRYVDVDGLNLGQVIYRETKGIVYGLFESHTLWFDW